MSFRYNLRTRARMPVTPKRTSGFRAKKGTSPIVNRTVNLRDEIAAVDSEWVDEQSGGVARTYSDVAASRPPSVVNAADETSVHVKIESPSSAQLKLNLNSPKGGESPESSLLSEADSEDEKVNGPWTEVKPRRSRSLESFRNLRLSGVKYDFPRRTVGLTGAQEAVVRTAAEMLTPNERAVIAAREATLSGTVLVTETVALHGEGSSNPKGKGPDPGNWGMVDLDPADLKPGVQEGILEGIKAAVKSGAHIGSLKRSPETIESSGGRVAPMANPVVGVLPNLVLAALKPSVVAGPSPVAGGGRSFKAVGLSKSRGVPEMLASTQLNPKSALGQVIRSTRSPEVVLGGGGDSSSSSSSSSSESSDDSSSSSASDRKRKRKSSSRRSRKLRKGGKAVERCILKPIPPEVYYGAPDGLKYHRFVEDGFAYVTDGKVPEGNKIRVLSHFLKDVAYEFYTRQVSKTIGDWSVEDFFIGLFNHCFPVNFRLLQREKLRKCYQNDRKVLTYTSELEELANMIGLTDEREMVLKLWSGLRVELQRELWKAEYNPEVSTWDDVKAKAQVMEIALAVGGSVGRSSQRDAAFLHPHAGKGFGSRKFQGGGSQPPGPRPDGGSPGAARSASGSGTRPKPKEPFRGGNGGSKSATDKRPQLSEKERTELAAAGKCFRCREVGHLSRNCPQGTFVRSPNGNSRPPGFASFSVEMQLEETERLRDLADTTQGLHEMALSSVELDLNVDEAAFWQMYTQEGLDIGDQMVCMTQEERAKCCERYGVDYFGDMVFPEDAFHSVNRQVQRDTDLSWSRLRCRPPRGRQHTDWSTILGEVEQANEESLFDLSQGTWRTASRFNYREPRLWAMSDSAPGRVGDLLAMRAMEHLEFMAPYPGDTVQVAAARHRAGMADSRFLVMEVDSAQHLIMDGLVDTYIPTERLLDPKFRLANWYAESRADALEIVLPDETVWMGGPRMGDALVDGAWLELSRGTCDYIGDPVGCDQWTRFRVTRSDRHTIRIRDVVRNVTTVISTFLLRNPLLDLKGWWGARLRERPLDVEAWEREQEGEDDDCDSDSDFDDDDDVPGLALVHDSDSEDEKSELSELDTWSVEVEDTDRSSDLLDLFSEDDSDTDDEGVRVNLELLGETEFDDLPALAEVDDSDVGESEDEDGESPIDIGKLLDEAVMMELFGAQVPRGSFAAVQRNAAVTKDATRVVPKPIVVVTKVNGHPARALLDSGSLGDFMSTTLADQLKVKRMVLPVPLPLQLAVQGSKGKINCGTRVEFEYGPIKEDRYFDIINLSNYDLILGTPWLFQYKATMAFNESRLVIGAPSAQPIKGPSVAKIASRATELYEDNLEYFRQELKEYAKELCRKASDTDLPPLRAINHTIPLIDVDMIYPWRPSKCPEALRPQWVDKKASYLRSGRWKVTSNGNTVPMLLIPKPGKKGDPPKLRTAVDLRARNKNTIKLSSPLPDIEGILRRAARARYRSIIDGQDAYEQIRIVPEHVERSTVTTPDGNMVSLVIQIGDCNAPATYQGLMNYLFSACIGRFMDVYLDDIVVYSNTLEDHVTHIKIIVDILKRERLYLSESKLHFLCKEMKVLGRIVDDDGIRMDPDKVDAVVNWKTPVNRDLLRGFLGSVGYLADDLASVRIPMGVLHGLTGDTVPFRWEFTHERAFLDIKRIAEEGREQHRTPIVYGIGQPDVFMVTDGCGTGVAGVVSQGNSWKTAKVAAFYSAKLNPAQQNYPVHEIEMLAGVETMLRHRDILQGVHFKWITDHKGLIHLLEQKNLSGRQARWMEKIGEFDFEVVYVAGTENVLADALSRIYSADEPGMVRARSEYTYFDVVDNDSLLSHAITMPLIVGAEARMVTRNGGNHPESSRSFARRMKGKFVLRGPMVPTEGVRRVDAATSSEVVVVPVKNEAVAEAVPSLPNNANTPEVDSEDPSMPADFSLVDESLTEVLKANGEGTDLPELLRGRYGEDKFFKLVLDKPKDYRNFEVLDGLIFLHDRERRLLCIPALRTNGRSVLEMVISEAHSLLAHLGPGKTVDYLRDNVWWKDMVQDTKSFCDSCVTCKRSKPSNQKPYGLLRPLKIPSRPWEAIGIDFVGPLPESSNRDGVFNSLTVVIDLLTAMVHLIPGRTTYRAREIAELVFEEVYKLHGLPEIIVSDRDVLFTSTFWLELNKLMGTKLHMSSSYHPQSDGSTERANRTITQMLRQCIDGKQKNWVEKLPAIEFAINSARSVSTGFAPFFLNTGRMPRPMIWDSMKKGPFPGVANFALKRKLALMAAHDSILAARVKQTRSANRKRRVSPFSLGELVYVSTANIKMPKGMARKLVPKYIGPYAITKDFKNDSFQVDLPRDLVRRGVHNGFHAEKLRAHVPNDDRLFPGRLASQIGGLEDSEGEWAVDRILDHVGKKKDSIFQMRWKSGDITWMPYYDVVNLEALESYYELLGVEGIASLPEGTGKLTEANELFAGGVGLELEGLDIKSARRSEKDLYSLIKTIPTSPRHRRHLRHPRIAASHIMFDFKHAFIDRPSRDRFTLLDPDALNLDRFSIHAAQVATFLDYDEQLRHGNRLSHQPAGYDVFARVYNIDCTDDQKFAEFDAETMEIIGGDSPGPDRSYFHVRVLDYAPAAREMKDGSKVITKEEVDANLFALTEFAARAKYRKEKVAQAVRERLEKKEAKKAAELAKARGINYEAKMKKKVDAKVRDKGKARAVDVEPAAERINEDDDMDAVGSDDDQAEGSKKA